ncbi:MAG: response regulator transcription factor [Anaerolineales bacterium]|nr:response regulator transcription factor [Anaerolineales bacterium]
MEVVHTKEDLFARAYGHVDDVILLDWELAQEDTPELVSQILDSNPQLRVVAMLPLNNRQYRQRVWEAGACNGIPKEHMDQEWLATVLCLMTRAIQREQKILTTQQAIL